MTSKRRLWICHGEKWHAPSCLPIPQWATLSPRSCPSSTYVFVVSLFLLFAAFNVGTEKALAYLLNLLLAMECSSRFGEKALHYAVYEMSNGSTWRYFFEWKFKHPWNTNTGFPTKLCPKRGKKASNLDINKCTKSRVTFHKPAVFLSKRESFFQCREVFVSSLTLGGIDYLYVPG